MMEAISFFISLVVISAGALLVTIASIVRMTWLAVVIPLLIAVAAAVGLFVLGRRTSRHTSGRDRRAETSSGKSRMAA
jgi:hypothetical protein